MKTLSSGNSIRIFKDERVDGALEPSDALRTDDEGHVYMLSKARSIEGPMRTSGVIRQMWGDKSDGKLMLFIETNIEVVPNHIISLLTWYPRPVSMPNTTFATLSVPGSTNIGVPFAIDNHHPIDRTLKTHVFQKSATVKAQAITLTNRHVSPHDIYHMLGILADSGDFPISKTQYVLDSMKINRKLTIGRNSLFILITAIYEAVLGGISLPRAPQKIGRLMDTINQYLQASKTRHVRIMSKNDPIPDDFTI